MIGVHTAVLDPSTLAICPPLAKFSGMPNWRAPVEPQRGEFRGRLEHYRSSGKSVNQALGPSARGKFCSDSYLKVFSSPEFSGAEEENALRF